MFRRTKLIKELRKENAALRSKCDSRSSGITHLEYENKAMRRSFNEIMRCVYGEVISIYETNREIWYDRAYRNEKSLTGIPMDVLSYMKKANRDISENTELKKKVSTLNDKIKILEPQLEKLTKDKLDLLFKIRGAKI